MEDCEDGAAGDVEAVHLPGGTADQALAAAEDADFVGPALGGGVSDADQRRAGVRIADQRRARAGPGEEAVADAPQLLVLVVVQHADHRSSSASTSVRHCR